MTYFRMINLLRTRFTVLAVFVWLLLAFASIYFHTHLWLKDSYPWWLLLSSFVFQITSIALLIRLLNAASGEYWVKANASHKGYILNEALGIYEGIGPKIYLPHQQAHYPQGVLLLHSFTNTPQDFKYLMRALEEKNIPYYAPLQSGCGKNSLSTLYKIRPQDWVAESVHAYQVMSAMCDSVSVVGTSMGSLLACHLAKLEPVDQLILISPAFKLTDTDEKIMSLFQKPWISWFAERLIPTFPKMVRKNRPTLSDTLDRRWGVEAFDFVSVTSRSYLTLYELTKTTPVQDLKLSGDMHVLFGHQDISINANSIRDYLHGFNIRFKEYMFENSAHNILADQEHHLVEQTILDILKQSQERSTCSA